MPYTLIDTQNPIGKFAYDHFNLTCGYDKNLGLFESKFKEQFPGNYYLEFQENINTQSINIDLIFETSEDSLVFWLKNPKL